MRTRTLQSGLLCTLFFGASAFAADPWTCPETIKTQQKLAAGVEGWDSFIDDVPHLLAYVTFYDGAPEEKASLVYDKTSRSGGKQVSVWTFGGNRRTWMTCSYSGSVVTLKKQLPAGTKTCTVTASLKEQIAGMQAIEKIVCK